MAEPNNTNVYVVAGREESRVNDRVIKILSLRGYFRSVTLVTPGSKISDEERLRVPPVVGLTGILRVLGLNGLKAKIDRYLYFPSLDIRFVWALRKPLLARLKTDLEAGREVCLVLTFPPHALGRLACEVKERLPQVRVVLDWQDLWSFDPNYAGRIPGFFQQRMQRWEREYIAAADLHLATNKRAAEVLVEHYGASPEQVGHIEHHFHPLDLIAGEGTVPVATHQAPVRLAFMGTLDKPPRVPGRELLEVLGRVNKTKRHVELHVYGHIPVMTAGEREQAVDQGIVFHGLVSHEEATRAMLSYDVLVLLLADMPNSRVVLSIKLPHYLLVDKPILAVVPGDSAIADVIAATGAGYVIDSSKDARATWQSELAAVLADEQRLRSLDVNRSQAAVDTFHWDKIEPRWQAAIAGEQSVGESI